ncbi:MAG: dihydroneopterin aldolase family protein [Halobacteriota archaeon]
MDANAREAACFEAGIKLGTLYHQFVGTPVAPETAPGLARAMGDAIERQPACRAAEVTLDVDRIEADRNRFGYTDLRGYHIEAEVLIEHDQVRVVAELALEEGYPRMRLTDVSA